MAADDSAERAVRHQDGVCGIRGGRSGGVAERGEPRPDGGVRSAAGFAGGSAGECSGSEPAGHDGSDCATGGEWGAEPEPDERIGGGYGDAGRNAGADGRKWSGAAVCRGQCGFWRRFGGHQRDGRAGEPDGGDGPGPLEGPDGDCALSGGSGGDLWRRAGRWWLWSGRIWWRRAGQLPRLQPWAAAWGGLLGWKQFGAECGAVFIGGAAAGTAGVREQPVWHHVHERTLYSAPDQAERERHNVPDAFRDAEFKPRG